MTPIVKAEEVFSKAAGFTAEEVRRILAAGAGRTVHFQPGRRHRRPRMVSAQDILMEFARGWTPDELAADHGTSRRRVFYILSRERTLGADAAGQAARLRHWKQQGLTWREVGRLYKVSHEKARRMAEEERQGEGRNQKAESKEQNSGV